MLVTRLNLPAISMVRKNKKISQQQMADALKISKSVYNRKELGKVPFFSYEIPVIAKMLGIESYNDLYCEVPVNDI